MKTIGLIYPDHAAESDFSLAEHMLGHRVRVRVEHIYGTDLHAVPELKDLGSDRRLADGIRLLRPHHPDVVVWACTSGSFVFGPDGAADQVSRLAAATGTPASSTSFAFTRALHTLGRKRVAIAASYPSDVATLFEKFLARAGVEVVHMASEGIDTAAEVGTLSGEDVLRLARRHDHPDAEVLLIPDTAMHTVALIDALEQHVGKPVLTANQVTVWEGLRLAGEPTHAPTLGALFTTTLKDGAKLA